MSLLTSNFRGCRDFVRQQLAASGGGHGSSSFSLTDRAACDARYTPSRASTRSRRSTGQHRSGRFRRPEGGRGDRVDLLAPRRAFDRRRRPFSRSRGRPRAVRLRRDLAPAPASAPAAKKKRKVAKKKPLPLIHPELPTMPPSTSRTPKGADARRARPAGTTTSTRWPIAAPPQGPAREALRRGGGARPQARGQRGQRPEQLEQGGHVGRARAHRLGQVPRRVSRQASRRRPGGGAAVIKSSRRSTATPRW